MVQERREIVTEESVERPVVARETVVERPATRVVEEPASTTYVRSSDSMGQVMATGTMIQTVVWAIVVLVILVVAVLVLLHLGLI